VLQGPQDVAFLEQALATSVTLALEAAAVSVMKLAHRLCAARAARAMLWPVLELLEG
jgi:hypothetical protein